MQPPLEQTEYHVDVKVTTPDSAQGEIYFIMVDPERILLNGKPGNKIIVTMKGGEDSKALFLSRDDMRFSTTRGQQRFPDIVFDGTVENGRLIATVDGSETDETIYVYTLTAHIIGRDITIRVDPEADNPPPPVPP